MTRDAEAPDAAPDLARFFSPRRVAFVGATEDLGKFGGRCVRQLIDFGYPGEIYPINPRRQEVFGRRCYASVADLPETPDHVGIVLPATGVPGALELCAACGVPFVTVFSAGFGETGTDEGRLLQARIVAIARAGGVRVMGPNCNGLVNFVDRFALTSTATIKGPRRTAGDIAVASQSGGAGQVNVMWRAQEAGLGISYQVSCGNDADLELLDYARFMVESAATRVVLLIAERIGSGAKLRALAERAAHLDKPIAMIKVGRTEAGSRAAASHTGAVTGADAVFDAALRQLGVVRVDDCSELYEAAMLLRRGWRPAGRRAAATAISGGNLVMLADLGGTLGLEWPPYGEATQAKLRAALPGFTAAANPTDMTAASIGRSDTLDVVGTAILADDNVDVLIPVLTMAPAAEVSAVAALSAGSEKPVAILWTGGATDDPALTPESLVASGHAVYRDALPCLKAVRAAVRYGEARARRHAPAPERPTGIDVAAARELLRNAVGPLSEHRSKALLRCYGLPLTREALAQSADDAVAHAQAIGGPVALKVQSPDLPHKTEAGAIRLGVAGESVVRQAFAEVLAAARAYRGDARIEGVLVQEMVTGGEEFLIGVSRDATFGPVVAFGLGGIYVEVLKDVAFGLPPLGADRVLAALRELRAFPLLAGARGRAPRDVAALVDCIVRVAWLATELHDVVVELDVNPICVLPEGHGVKIVDALVVAGSAA